MTQSALPAEAVLQRQMEAYNRRDIDAFCAFFAPNAVTRLYENDEVLAEGIEALRELYGRRFRENPNLHLQVQTRMVLDNVVVDRELITGFDGGSTVEAIAIYEVRNGLIERAQLYPALRCWIK